MKRIVILLVLFSLFNMISAQGNEDVVYEKHQDHINTLFGNEHVSNGGYGAFSFGYAEIENLNALTIGGRGAWIIEHWIAIGFGGAGFINETHYNSALTQDVNISGGYGGLLLEPILFPRIPVHISLPVLFGAGGIAYITSSDMGNMNEYPAWVEDAASFAIIEPGAELEFNVVHFFRLSVGISYRFTTEIDLYDTSAFPLNGWTGNVTFKFGKF